MFGLLKKNDFDSQNTLIQSKIAELSATINASFLSLNNDVNLIKNQLNDIQHSFIKFEKNIDFDKMIDNIKANFLNHKNSSANRFLEDEMNHQINFQIQKQGFLSLSEVKYPNFINSYKLAVADIVTYTCDENDNNIVDAIFELKRWDSKLDQSGTPTAWIKDDRAYHWISFNTLCISKNNNSNAKHYFIVFYETYPFSNYPTGYLAAKKKSSNNNYGPFEKCVSGNLKKEIISNEFEKIVNNNTYFDNYINEYELSFNKMYDTPENGIFDFEYVDVDNLQQNYNNGKSPLVKKQCKVIKDTSVINTDLSASEFNTATLQYLLSLPSNWRLRIIEVL